MTTDTPNEAPADAPVEDLEAKLAAIDAEVVAAVTTPPDLEAAAEGPLPEPAAPAAPEKPALTVKKRSVKGNAVVVEGEATERTDGETRTQTDAGPVQLAAVRQEPREVEELEFPGLKIIRERY